tara:strand:- start:472 stop:636 length:165 start_codon:yes stop_codon:yes gene_type:complete
VDNPWATLFGFFLNSFSTNPQAPFKLKPNLKSTETLGAESGQKKLTKHNNKNNI